MNRPDTPCLSCPTDAATGLGKWVPFSINTSARGDTLLHAQMPYVSHGFAQESTPFSLRSDGWSPILLLLALLLAARLVLRLGRKTAELTRAFFLPIPGRTDEPLPNDPLRTSTRLLAVSLLALSAAAITFVVTQHDAYYLFPTTPYLIFALFLAIWLAYFALKKWAGNFVNWVFFRKEKIFTWQRACNLLCTAEAFLALLLALAAVYLPVSRHEVLLAATFLIIFVKTLLLFKTYQIFFPKMYGILHLIVYLCSLELVPLLIVLQVLAQSDWIKVIKI